MSGTLFDSLESWVEGCRDLGRGALRTERIEAYYGARRTVCVPLEVALDILDREMDNVLGRIQSLKEQA